MVEERGLLRQFVEHRTVKIVEAAIKRFQKEQTDQAVKEARTHLLLRKYGLKWKDTAYRKALHRRAKVRRSLFAQTARQERNRQRGDDELQEILRAKREKEEVQRAQRRDSLGRGMSNSPPGPTIIRPFQPVAPVAGKKRKSLQADTSESTIMNKAVLPTHGHKRSRTMDGSHSTFAPPQPTQLSPPGESNRSLLSSTLSGRSNLLNYPDSPEIQSAARRMKVDRTNTDYFRLKARGIDPETTVIPHTKSSLERKRRREEQDTSPSETSLTWTERRNRAATTTERVNPVLAKALNSKASPPPASASVRSTSAPKAGYVARPTEPASVLAQSVADDDDEFLRQIREVRYALTQDTHWYKEQAGKFEEEARNQSSSLNSSVDHRSPPGRSSVSPSGAPLVNGYEFAPSSTRISSRSEHRLRQTGGHGLASRPVADYLPGGSRYLPAMSKRSAEAIRRVTPVTVEQESEIQLNSKYKGKGKVVDPSYRYESDQDDDDDEEEGQVFQESKGKDVHRSQPIDVEVVEDDEPADPDTNANGHTFPEKPQEVVPEDSLGEEEEYDQDEGAGKVQYPDLPAQIDDEVEEQSQDEGQYEEEGEQYEDEEGDATNGQVFYRKEEDDADEEEGASYDEEDYDEEEEEEEEGEDDERPGNLPNIKEHELEYGRLKRVLRSATPEEPDLTASRSRSTSQGIGLSGPGASQDDALVLSD